MVEQLKQTSKLTDQSYQSKLNINCYLVVKFKKKYLNTIYPLFQKLYIDEEMSNSRGY